MAGDPKPGWLQRSIDEARRLIILSHTPQDLMRQGESLSLPLDKATADWMFTRFDAHFFAWTGRHLGEWKTG